MNPNRVSTFVRIATLVMLALLLASLAYLTVAPMDVLLAAGITPASEQCDDHCDWMNNQCLAEACQIA